MTIKLHAKNFQIMLFILIFFIFPLYSINFDPIEIVAKQLNIQGDTLDEKIPTKNTDLSDNNAQYLSARILLGDSLLKKEKFEHAIEYYKKALALDPKLVDVHCSMGKALKHIEMFDEAIQHYKTVLTISPEHIETLIELGNIFSLLTQYKDALSLYLKAFEINPKLIHVQYNIGYTLKKLGYIDKAISIYQKVLMQQPDYALAHFSLGLAYLSIGDFEHGWEEYQWRWKAFGQEPKTFTKPVWNGCDLHGKTLYVYAEQGLGDMFQFVRYLKLVKERGATIIFEVQKELKDILSLIKYVDAIVTKNDTIPAFDYHIPLMSLPLIFNTRLETIPADIPYLNADKNLEQEWREKLAKDRNFKIGISWHGNSHYKKQTIKKIAETKWVPLKILEKLCKIEGISIYSLQKVDGIEQLQDKDHSLIIQEIDTLDTKAAESQGILYTFGHDFDESHGRFMDSAAIIKNLDLIISVDSAIGHLAGGLGVPVWLMLPHTPDWRWLTDRIDSPWYPTMRLFIQDEPGNWESVIDKLVEALILILQQKETPHTLNLEDLIDHMTQYEIEKRNNYDLKQGHPISFNHDYLQRMYQEYLAKYPSLNMYIKKLTDVNNQLIYIDKQLAKINPSTQDPIYIDLARKACYAYDVKTDLKNKIRSLVLP